MRAALYPRVSGEKQVREGYGLAYQEADLSREADRRGFTVVEVVTEPAFERSEFHRPGLERQRELAKAGEIDCVLTWKRDRYFAGLGLRALFEKEMEPYGVKLARSGRLRR